jgi:20S proteasome alpha/beta subunit
MTVCIAAISHSNPWPLIIAACDRKLSFFDGYVSAEGVAMKIAGINDNWTVMFSGPVSPMTALVYAVTERMEKKKQTNVRTFARLCRAVYRQERKALIESEVLGEYDIESYDEYLAMRKTEPEFHAQLGAKIREEEGNWNLLFAGFCKEGRAHIFTIEEAGKIGFHDAEGYAAIGSGGWRALLSLSSYPFKRSLPLSEAIFGVAAAKFSAESANGVGEETNLTVLEPGRDTSPVFSDPSIKELRKMWIDLPRFPGNNASEVVWKQLKFFQDVGWLKKPDAPKPLASQK